MMHVCCQSRIREPVECLRSCMRLAGLIPSFHTDSHTSQAARGLPDRSEAHAETLLTRVYSKSMGSPITLWWPQPGRHCLVRCLLHASARLELASAQVRNTVRFLCFICALSALLHDRRPGSKLPTLLLREEGVLLFRILPLCGTFLFSESAHSFLATRRWRILFSRTLPLMQSGNARLTTSLK